MASRRWVIGAIGFVLLGLTWWSPTFRDGEGLIQGSAVLPAAAGIGCLILAAAPTNLFRSASWLAVSLIAAAAAVQLAVAGPPVRYQHYLPWGELASHPLPTALVLGHIVLILVAAGRVFGARTGRLLRSIGAPRTVGLFLLMAAAAATVSKDLPRYGGEVVLALLIRLAQIGNMALLVAAIPAERRAALGGWLATHLGPVDESESPSGRSTRLAWGLAIATTIFAVGLNTVAYGRHPHVPDEYHYLWQARYFAQGYLSLPLPPAPRAFDIYLTGFQPEGWYSVVPPGWPAILAIGARFGLESLVNPLLAGANLLLAERILSGMLSQRTTRLALLLLAVAPWHYLLAMTYMGQTSTMTLLLVAAWAVTRARSTGLARWGWLGGAGLGALAIVRQLDAMIAAVALGLWAIGLGGRRIRWSGTAGLVLGAMAVAALVLPYNRHFTGKASTFPVMAYNDQRFGPGTNDYGFGKNRGMGWELDPNPGHGPVDGLINTNLNLSATEVDLFGWATGSLLLIGLAVLSGRWTQADRLMIGLIGLTWFAYFLNYFSGGPDFGARYWFLMLIPFVVLTARGLLRLGAILADASGPSLPRAASDGAAISAVAALVVGSLVVYLPWRSVDKYRHFRGMRPDIRALARDHHFGRSLILINGKEVPDYASAAVYNPVLLSADQPVYAWNRDSLVAPELRAAFPDRPVWVLDGPTVTGAGYRIKFGPVAPGAPLP